MTAHTMMPIPDPDAYLKLKGGGTRPLTACTRCGAWDTSALRYQDCDKCYNDVAFKAYQAGGKYDPFASMRINGKVPHTGGGGGTAAGGTYTISAGGPSGSPSGSGGGGLGSAGTGPHGMPIRRDMAQEAAANSCAPKVEPPETRPGLAPESIDWEAYKSFGRNL